MLQAIIFYRQSRNLVHYSHVMAVHSVQSFNYTGSFGKARFKVTVGLVLADFMNLWIRV